MRTKRVETSEMELTNDEIRIAEEIVSILPAGVARTCSSERAVIRYSVRGPGMKLRTVVFSRVSLRRLAGDPAREVKIEYLQRDLVQSAPRRAEFRYPRTLRVPRAVTRRPFTLGLPLASMV